MSRSIAGSVDVAARVEATGAVVPAARLWQWFCLGLLGLALGYGIVNAGGRSFIEWNVCLLLVGLAALVYWLRTRPDDLAPAPDRGLLWAVMLAPASIALQLIPLPLLLVNIASP